jgi:8-oxo-dGTP diphosphatase
VSICVFRGPDVLMIERGKAPGIGLWAPVGGGIEPGETPEAAALREVAEETAVACRLIGRVGVREIAVPATPERPAGRIELVVFAAAWISGEPVAGDDAAKARFVALAAIEDLPLMAGVAPWIHAARRLHDGVEA